MRSEKIPSASVSAKPRRSVPRWPSAAEGLRSEPDRNWPNRLPRPMPAPAMPRQARPAPMYFAATGSIENSSEVGKMGSGGKIRPSVAGVKGVVEVDRGENGEDVGLQHRDQHLKGRERDGEREWQRRQNAPEARGQQGGDEAREDFERDMARQHVGEKAHREAERARHEGDDLDRDEERQEPRRHAGRHEQAEEMRPMLHDAVDDDGADHER